jgi:hypothetical protein
MATSTIYTNRDTYSYEAQPDTNKNAAGMLEVRGASGWRRRTYIGFDVTSAPAASTVSSVKLYLYLVYDGDGAITGRFNRITGSWTESGLTWNNAPAVTATNQVTHSMPVTPSSTWYNFDITDIYKDAKNAGNECGVKIMDHNESNDSHQKYEERESAYDPYILITYTAVYDDYYVKIGGNDSLDGGSWANAWLTINKAATTVTDGKTVHIGFGTYNAEPANNKITPQNAGATGIKYLCETATTGGGTGSVIIEKN